MNRINLLAFATATLLMADAYAQQANGPKPQQIYSCMRDGVRHYLSSHPLPTDRDCRVIAYKRSAPERPPGGNYFRGYACKSDCSGHQAGYEWAYRRGASSYAGCTGNSQSFIEGCRSYIDEMNSKVSR